MALTRLTVARRRGTGYPDTVSSPYSASQRLEDTTLSLLRTAAVQVDGLKRALLLSQQESIAAREQVAILTNAHVQRNCLAFRPEVARTPMPLSSVWASPDFALCSGLESDEMSLVQTLFTRRSRFRKGDVLYRVGDRVRCALRDSRGLVQDCLARTRRVRASRRLPHDRRRYRHGRHRLGHS